MGGVIHRIAAAMSRDPPPPAPVRSTKPPRRGAGSYYGDVLLPDRSSNIRKLQRRDHLPQPSQTAIYRHRERRREIEREQNEQELRKGRWPF